MATKGVSRPINEEKEIDIGRPADFSFKKFKTLEAIGTEGARSSRIGGIPEKGTEKRKYLTRAVWLNNNKLKTIKNLDLLVNSILEKPQKLGWIDFSFNYITDIDDCILKFPHLKIVYFHGNSLCKIEEVAKLRDLAELRSVTFHGNPIADLPNYRKYVITILPQIVNLDFGPVVNAEKLTAAPSEALKKLKELESAKAKT